MNVFAALLRAMRPQQWTKNLFVFAPLLFAGQVDHEGVLRRVEACFAIFCLVSSAVYLMNDVVDREADRLHPEKCGRPVASGALPVSVAISVAGLLAAGGLAWAWFGLASRWPVTIVGIYLVIQVAYTGWLKRVVLLDVLCIASGFVLRLLAGSTAAWVPSSRWIVVCTIFLALFLALCKRRHEVVVLGEAAAGHRAILAHYPLPLLDQLIGVATSATLVTYALFAVDGGHLASRAADVVSPMALTIPFVIHGVFRYLFLVHMRDGGGSPGATLARDPISLVNALLYVAAVVAARAWVSG